MEEKKPPSHAVIVQSGDDTLRVHSTHADEGAAKEAAQGLVKGGKVAFVGAIAIPQESEES